MAVDRESLPKGIGLDADAAGQLCRELELAGVQPLLTLDSDCVVSGGVTLAAPRVANEQFRQQVLDIVMQGLPLSVSLSEDCGDCILEVLRESASDKLEIVVNGVSSPRDWLSSREEHLGHCIVHFLADCDEGALDLSEIWSLRSEFAPRISYGAHVLPVCPLLSAESAGNVLPQVNIQIPSGTAWLPVRFDLRRFADEQGRIDEAMVADALSRCVEICDRLHEHVCWPTPLMRHDAWLNRRLAIVIDGIGDMAVKQGLDPRSFRTLEMLGRMLGRMRDEVRARSRLIAERTQSLPALEHFDPSESLPGGLVRSNWRRKWLDAVELSGLRHRNLVVLSPWALFPKGRPADFRYSDLLPLLRFADACALGEAPELSAWSANEFRAFHRRAMAVLQQRIAMHQIAERI